MRLTSERLHWGITNNNFRWWSGIYRFGRSVPYSYCCLQTTVYSSLLFIIVKCPVFTPTQAHVFVWYIYGQPESYFYPFTVIFWLGHGWVEHESAPCIFKCWQNHLNDFVRWTGVSLEGFEFSIYRCSNSDRSKVLLDEGRITICGSKSVIWAGAIDFCDVSRRGYEAETWKATIIASWSCS